MLRADVLGHLHQRAEGVEVPDAAERHEHLAQLESEEPRHGAADLPEDVDESRAVQGPDRGAGEQDRCAARGGDRGGLAAVERRRIARLAFDERAGDERASPGELLREREHLGAFGPGEQVRVAGVHVDRRRQARDPGALDESGPGIAVGATVVGERQEHGGDAFDRAARTERKDGHGPIKAETAAGREGEISLGSVLDAPPGRS